eukprot:TRINITY_DN12431_c0_g1_i1.p3 TRINITY_DN12431_c0_g1~~TRINITY_DN12431_c0_g1_i1.p3  ORF type:complete len:51 (+),score=6.34 TRINITY_DN12431_c0_g1_i1:235-387(+)
MKDTVVFQRHREERNKICINSFHREIPLYNCRHKHPYDKHTGYKITTDFF